MRYLLDTNMVIALSKQVPPVVDRLDHCLASDILLSAVVLAEIE
jgi:predicted nucleic acid-binding protein